MLEKPDLSDIIKSPCSPSADGKQGTGMQISMIVEARLHNAPVERVLPVRDGARIDRRSW